MKLVVLLLVCLWAASITLNATAATGKDSLKVAWYLKGEGDAVMPTFGLVITDLTCVPQKSYVACKLRSVTPDYKKSLCSIGRFTLKDFAVTGQWTKPKPCLTS